MKKFFAVSFFLTASWSLAQEHPAAQGVREAPIADTVAAPLVGEWRAHLDAGPVDFEVTPDGQTRLLNGKDRGTWTVEHDRFVIRWRNDSINRVSLPLAGDAALAELNSKNSGLPWRPFLLTRRQKTGKAAGTDALAQTLISHNWIWAESVSGTKKLEHLRFYKAGYAQNPEWFTARWECTGPRTFILHNTNHGTHMDGKVAYLVFDEALVHFVGIDFDGKSFVEGFRREAVDPNREPPVPVVR